MRGFVHISASAQFSAKVCSWDFRRRGGSKVSVLQAKPLVVQFFTQNFGNRRPFFQIGGHFLEIGGHFRGLGFFRGV